MTTEKLLEVVAFYEQELATAGIECVKHEEAGWTNIERLRHVRWMTSVMPAMVEQGLVDKAHRWLGFIQGVLFSLNRYSLTALRNHSRSSDDEA